MCLDCPLRRYLPYFSMQGSGADQITIRQLLTHSAGTGDTSDFSWRTPEYDDGAVERYVRSLALCASISRRDLSGATATAASTCSPMRSPKQTVARSRSVFNSAPDASWHAAQHSVDERYRFRAHGAGVSP